MSHTEQLTREVHSTEWSEREDATEQLVYRRLADEFSYSFYFRDITCHFSNGVLTLRGRLPTFYLKQILQTRLRDLKGVDRIDNQVDVVSTTGLSSVRPK